jgi:hypothetical protein
MKKIYRTSRFLIIAFIVLLIAIHTQSCKDFLDEELITTESTQSFETKEGLDKLSIGTYQNLEFHFNYEWAYTIWQYGTDEMAVGNDGIMEHYNSYTSAFNSESGNGMTNLWDNMYSGISSANTLIKNVPLFYDKNSSTYNTRLGEGYFMRGFNYFRLVQQFGGVPLILEPVEGAKTDFVRNSAEEVYAQIIEDLTNAYDLLPSQVSQIGRLSKWAAAHFLAKAYLFRSSEINDSWNSQYKESDLTNVIKYSKEVIAAHPLCDDFVSLWDFTMPDGPNEQVSEVILASQFSDDTNSQGRYGNQVHLYYPSIYQNIPGLKRDISGDREFSRMRTTNYALDVFDRINDSRFWKSFITTYRCNNPSAAPTWGNYAPEDKNPTDKKFVGGEIAVKYIVNNAGDERFTENNIKYMAPHMFIRYFADETPSYLNSHGNYGSYSTKSRYVALSKFRDGSRTSVASQFGQRDGILARSAEDYLMIAEAYGRLKEYNNALPYINALRKRAGFSEGEDRSKNVDGGQAYLNNPNISIKGDGGSGSGFAVYSDKNTYYESNNIDEAITTSTKSTMEFESISDIFNSEKEFYSELGANTDEEKFMIFIMNERSRELMGELLRWPDLARTKQLEKRFKTFNDGSLISGSNFDPNKHYLRPIPQSFLDAITKNGVALTSEEKQAMQNPGW